MALASGTLVRQNTELTNDSYDSAIEDAQNPNPHIGELLATKPVPGLMRPPKTSPKRALQAAKTPSPKKLCLKAPEAEGNQHAREGARTSPSGSEEQEGMSPGPSLSERSVPANKGKRSKSPTYWRPADLQAHP